MYPSSWGTKEYADPPPDREIYDIDFPAGLGTPTPKRERAPTHRNPPIFHAMTSPLEDYPMLQPPSRLTHDVWKLGKGDVWIQEHGRNFETIADDHRHFVRHMVRGVGDQYRMGVRTGDISVAVVLGSVVVDVSEGNSELKVALETYLKTILGDDQRRKELQHFYSMIKISTPDNFWLLEYHPVLLGTWERYSLPNATRVGLDKDKTWETLFGAYMRRINGDVIQIGKLIRGQADFIEVFDKNNHRDPIKGFCPNSVGLLRFARTLFIHGADQWRHLQYEVVEHELSNRFDSMLTNLFQFLFVHWRRLDLGFLAEQRPPIEDGLL